jgi:hypothetical protein
MLLTCGFVSHHLSSILASTRRDVSRNVLRRRAHDALSRHPNSASRVIPASAPMVELWLRGRGIVRVEEQGVRGRTTPPHASEYDRDSFRATAAVCPRWPGSEGVPFCRVEVLAATLVRPETTVVHPIAVGCCVLDARRDGEYLESQVWAIPLVRWITRRCCTTSKTRLRR